MVVCYSLDPIMKYILSQATSSAHSTTTNGPHIQHLQLSLVSPAIASRYTLQISRFTRRGEGKVILVLETVTILLASIYRGFLVRMRSHPRLVNPPRLGGNPR